MSNIEIIVFQVIRVNKEYQFETAGIAGKAGKTLLTIGYASKGPIIRATFFFNLSCNIVVLQVETLYCAYYHVCDQLVSQQNIVLQVCIILHV